MILGQPGTDRYRYRLGLAFLCAGVLFLLWAWGSWLFRASAQAQDHAPRLALESRSDGALSKEPPHGAAGGNRAKFLRASPLFLLVGLLLVLTFLLGSLAAVRLIRRYRLRVEATRRGPSAYEDVWSMHKIPPRDEELDD
ncbi:MAG: hypothetical protein AABZ12_02690 [Planctomycetota bacterium]